MDVLEIQAWLAGLDPDELTSDQCAEWVDRLSVLSKCCDAARARMAAKAAAGMAHVRRGYVEPGDWLAQQAGTSTAEARRAIDTAESIDACPATEAAWRNGEISSAQAAEITKTEAVQPGSEKKLLETARTAPLRRLKEQAQHQRLAAVDADELRHRQQKARHFRHWRDDEGMIRIAGALVPE